MEIGNFKFARRTNPDRLQPSQIRYLLALAESGFHFAEGQEDVISMAGGFPNPKTFPAEKLLIIADRLISRQPSIVLQYSPTPGLTKFREFLAEYYGKKYGIRLTKDNVLITTSSQQALDLVARAFCESGSTVICSSPTYLGAIQAFRFAGAKFTTLSLEQDGISINGYRELIASIESLVFHYEIPFNQNPGGVTLSKEKAEYIASITSEHGIPVVEDNPYCELWFDRAPSFCSFLALDLNNTLSLHTISKTIAPGLRVGFIIGPKEVIEKISGIKQPADLCTSALDQLIVYEYMASCDYETHLEEIRNLYRDNCHTMLEAMERFLPKDFVTWNNPQGGLFLWLNFRNGLNSHDILEECLRQIPHGVAFVEGAQFCPDGTNTGARINFSFPSKPQIVTAIKILGETISKVAEQKALVH